jgi:polar amino acid transport system substrate-binding protein
MKTILLLLGLVAVLSGAAPAQTFTIYPALIPPYVLEAKGGHGRGVIIEILAQALDDAKIPYRIADSMPWRRAQAEAIDEPNSLIAPFARTPGREPDWNWITDLLDEKMYIYVPSDTSTIASERDLSAVRHLGVLAGGAPESVAKELGLAPVAEPVAAEAQNATKLAMGRLDAWMSQGLMASWGMRYAGVGPDKIKIAFLLRELPLWVATSKKTDPAQVERLRLAFETFRKQPAYREIISQY